MAREMSDGLTIALSAVVAEDSSPEPAEERATFGLLTMTANGRPLTMVEDADRREVRRGAHLAGYPLAEWLLWSRWRLRWEFGRPSEERAARGWDFAHRMAAIGGGYAWPNVTIFSDGLLSFLISEPSPEPDAALFPYLGAARRETVPAASLEAAIDGFATDVLACLDGRELRETNLHRLWSDLTTERQDPEQARFRRLEAQLGCDPDEVDESAIRRHLDDAAELGEEALGEVAADAATRGDAPNRMTSAAEIAETAKRRGFDADPKDAVTLDGETAAPQRGEAAAWRVGDGIARTIRDRERLDGQPLADARLAAMAGTTDDAISRAYRRSDGLCFALDRPDGARLVLRSKRKTGRRFELARLIGDRLIGAHGGGPAETLLPATRTYSYRQKAQRAFAAELLSPFAAVADMLGDDYASEDRQMEVARHFGVSPMTIRTQLVDHGRLDREAAPDVAERGAASTGLPSRDRGGDLR